MKKAKVRDGIVQHVWPWTKTLPDGTKVVKELPMHYRVKPQPSFIVNVPDKVKPGWVWNGKVYAPRVKAPLVKLRDPMIEVLAEKLGIAYEDLLAEAKARKRAAAKKA